MKSDDPHQADAEKCGQMLGARRCIYLIISPFGTECGRAYPEMKVELERKAKNGYTTAQHKPNRKFPNCQPKV